MSNKTVRAPLFSEQVALSAHLDEAAAQQLKLALDRAQGGGSASKNNGSALRSTGAVVGFFGIVAGIIAVALNAQQNQLVIFLGLGLAAVGLILALMAANAEAMHAAALIRALAQAIAKRKKDGTNPGAPNPLK